MHEWVNHQFFPPAQQSTNVKIQKTAAHPKLAAWNRLVKDGVRKLWGSVENRWAIWPWRSSAIYVWKHQPGVPNMSGQFDELMDKKRHFKGAAGLREQKNTTQKNSYTSLSVCSQKMHRAWMRHAALPWFLPAWFQQQTEISALSRKQAELNAAPWDSIVDFIVFCK